MYFPYLRGKQHELLALRACAPMLASNRKVIPIIEPVRKDISPLLRAVKVCASQRLPIVIVVNPTVGQLAKEHKLIVTELTLQQVFSAGPAIASFIISQGTSMGEIDSFLTQFNDSRVAFIHSHRFQQGPQLVARMASQNIAYQIFIDGVTGSSYQGLFRQHERVLIRDGFRVMNNADYPADEFFSELHQTYAASGFNGFGDFTIAGKDYSDRGGPAHAVAIHLTHPGPDADLWIRHFVSDRTKTTKDRAGKFMEALEKLVRFLDENRNVAGCEACSEFQDLHSRRHFPGLGTVKQLSIRHHLEMMTRMV
jgi:hypothetical protein